MVTIPLFTLLKRATKTVKQALSSLELYQIYLEIEEANFWEMWAYLGSLIMLISLEIFHTLLPLAHTSGSAFKKYLSGKLDPSIMNVNEGEHELLPCLVEYAVSIQRCYLVILDPKRIGEDDALIARLDVSKHLNFPLGFHGFWATDM
uniref:Uncharacterized protein n=1 Tax=Quercus lobata TaxID=97700 RepID=A0A7N2LFL6_QUELO